MTESKKRIVALISGPGSTLQGLIDATRWETVDAEVVGVVSHERWCYGLLRAEREGIPTMLHDLSDYRYTDKTEREYVSDLIGKIDAFRPDLVILSNWNVPLNDDFFQHYRNRVLNLHSGVPGQYLPIFDPYAQNPVSRAFEAYSSGAIREAQVSVQMLTGMEVEGRIIAQQRVPIYEADHLVDLEDRMQRVQQELLVNTLRLLLRTNQLDVETQDHTDGPTAYRSSTSGRSRRR